MISSAPLILFLAGVLLATRRPAPSRGWAAICFLAAVIVLLTEF